MSSPASFKADPEQVLRVWITWQSNEDLEVLREPLAWTHRLRRKCHLQTVTTDTLCEIQEALHQKLHEIPEAKYYKTCDLKA
jgi:hypothetical protein